MDSFISYLKLKILCSFIDVCIDELFTSSYFENGRCTVDPGLFRPAGLCQAKPGIREARVLFILIQNRNLSKLSGENRNLSDIPSEICL